MESPGAWEGCGESFGPAWLPLARPRRSGRPIRRNAGPGRERPGDPIALADRIRRQGQAGRAPTAEDPGQQRGEAGGHVELGAMLARLGVGRLVELLEPRAERVEALAQQGDQGGDDTVEAAAARKEHAKALEGQYGGLGPRELREGIGDHLGARWVRASARVPRRPRPGFSGTSRMTRSQVVTVIRARRRMAAHHAGPTPARTRDPE